MQLPRAERVRRRDEATSPGVFRRVLEECQDGGQRPPGTQAMLSKQGIRYRKCLDLCSNQRGIVRSYLSPILTRFSCVKDDEKKMIPHADIRELINQGETKIQESAQTFLKTMGGGKELVDTAVSVGKCMKDCFLQKNSGGFCFDKHE